MVEPVGQTTFAEGFDETSFLFVGVALLLALLAAQILWAQYNRRGSGRTEKSDAGPMRPEEKREGRGMGEDVEGRGIPTTGGEDQEYQVQNVEAKNCDFEGEAIRCPECAKPTEAEYRFCRHCASDTGKSYVGGGNDDGSSRSGMF